MIKKKKKSGGFCKALFWLMVIVGVIAIILNICLYCNMRSNTGFPAEVIREWSVNDYSDYMRQKGGDWVIGATSFSEVMVLALFVMLIMSIFYRKLVAS